MGEQVSGWRGDVDKQLRRQMEKRISGWVDEQNLWTKKRIDTWTYGRMKAPKSEWKDWWLREKSRNRGENKEWENERMNGWNLYKESSERNEWNEGRKSQVNQAIRRPAGVSDWKVLFLVVLFMACPCSIVLFPRLFASSESKSPPTSPLLRRRRRCRSS